jgi:MoaA/NifB/PqqE/SkfB family radical SAM enzyme
MGKDLQRNIEEALAQNGQQLAAGAGNIETCCGGSDTASLSESKAADALLPGVASQFTLNKLYIEPTNRCNLDCRTCMRNSWNEPMGYMSKAVFAQIIDGVKSFSPVPEVFFGGFGEPLSHPQIVEMVSEAKKTGAVVKLITNGILLTPDMSRSLLEAGIDFIWISIDGATPESYADIRLGAALPQVLENIKQFNHIIMSTSYEECCAFIPQYKTRLGITFVAMKRNIADLPAVLKIGRELKVEHILVTNVLPYTKEMCEEILYSNLWDGYGDPSLTLPRMNPNAVSLDRLYREVNTVNWLESHISNAINRCPFIDKGCGAISWDGNFSPCLALLHSNTGYVMGYTHSTKCWKIGNVQENSLKELWNNSTHLDFRERVKKFDFPPCSVCRTCDFFENNEEDCWGNIFPVCGGCLWAQGLIRCP